MRQALRTVAAGLLLGGTWGVLARIWMRLISTHPEFSWSGTSMIVGAAAVAGGLLGLVRAARTRGGRPEWRLAAVPGLVLFLGPGLLLLPALVLGGWAWGSRRAWPLRVVVALVPVGLPAWLWAVATPEAERALLSPWSFFVGIYLLSAALAAAGSVWFAAWPQRVPTPTPGALAVA